MVWSFFETFALNGFGFIQGVILARLLMPSDYGLIAMTGVFFAISYTLVDSGFTTALIRKKERKEIDYSTVYVTNLTLSFLLSAVLCVCSSLIADFYEQPLLKEIVCVNAALMFCGSFIAVQGAKLSIELNFKAKSIINVISTVTTGIGAIILAFCGFGVWSLILPNFVSIAIKAFLYWRYQHWFPKLRFSLKVWKEYFRFGSNLMISGLLNTFYNNVYPLVIGKCYTAADLGYYNKADGYSQLPSSTVTGILGKVSFPVLAKIQDDTDRLRDIYRRMIRVAAFIVFPIMFLLAVLAKPFIVVLITDKWIDSIPYLQILCFVMMWYPIHALNLNLLQVKGRSDLFLRLEVLKKIIGIAILVVTVPLGLIYMCYGSLVSSILCLLINTYYTGKLIDVGFVRQMKDIFPTVILSALMYIVVYIFILFIPSLIIQLILGSILGLVSYISIAKIIKSKDLNYFLDLLENNLPQKWHRIIKLLR